ncbi:MAG TPA: hypothetical protein VEI28_00095 [Thermodesulfovibrionales bacterium]|nr:hypothetical protein [Thermodesulfovibrionales bacterium]
MQGYVGKVLKNKLKEPSVPQERHQTVRRKIMDVLDGNSFSARDISAEVGISVREVFEHLGHIQKTRSRGDDHLVMTPAVCKKCGFVFKKRERLKKPGKCPVCRAESIQEPLFSLGRTGVFHDNGAKEGE